jgi:transposase
VKTTDTIDIFDRFVSQIKEETFVVLDNASIHKSKLFNNKANEWKEKGLHLLYLPPYSPQLNKIELCWKHIKEQNYLHHLINLLKPWKQI